MLNVNHSLPSLVFSSSLLLSSSLLSSSLLLCLALTVVLADLLGAVVGAGGSVFCCRVTGSAVVAVVPVVKVKKLSVVALSSINAVSGNPPRRSTPAKKHKDFSIFFVCCCKAKRKKTQCAAYMAPRGPDIHPLPSSLSSIPPPPPLPKVLPWKKCDSSTEWQFM